MVILGTITIACGETDDSGQQRNDVIDTQDTMSDTGTTADVPQVRQDARGVRNDAGVRNGTDIPQCNSNEECDDGLFCNGLEQCRPGFPGTDTFGCRPGNPPSGFDPDPTDCTILGPCSEETDGFPLVPLSTGEQCTDGIACTVEDTCQADGTCEGIPTDSLCNDDLFCNGEESCSTLIGCVAGLPPTGLDPVEGDCLVVGPCEEATDSFTLIPADIGVQCNDDIDCTTDDVCTAAGTCLGTPDHTACSDGQFCNGPEQCIENVGCEPSIGPATPPEDDTPNDCFAPTECNEETDSFDQTPLNVGAVCDDGIDCTNDDNCDEQQTCTGTANDNICDDGIYCNGPETCDASTGCIEGSPPTPPIDPISTDCIGYGPCDDTISGFPYDVPVANETSCDDAVDCTLNDTCDSAGQCAGTPDDSVCDDSLFCNGQETCAPVNGCLSGLAPTGPDDINPTDCLTPTCDETTQSFIDGPATAGTGCDDGISCTKNDECDGAAGCTGTSDDAACDDGTYCNGAESCDSLNDCQPGVAPTPSEANTNSCLVSFCDETANIVTWVNAESGSTCDDGVECTAADQCDGAGTCAGTPDNSACDDGTFCNGAEACDPVEGCKSGTNPTPVDDNLDDCNQPFCDESTDSIITAPVPNSQPCDDGDPNTGPDECTDGVCVGN